MYLPHDMDSDGKSLGNSEACKREHAVSQEITASDVQNCNDRNKGLAYFRRMTSTSCLKRSQLLYSRGNS
jgi:hypothetical protein